MKKILAAILLVVMVFCFASCGQITKTEAPTLNYLYNTGEGHQAIGEYIQSALAAAGLNMTLTNQEWNTFLNTRKDGNYTIARNGWLADYSDPISSLICGPRVQVTTTFSSARAITLLLLCTTSTLPILAIPSR